MKKSILAIAALCTMMLCACGNKQKEQEQPNTKKETKVGNLLEEVNSYRERQVKDSVQIEGKTYVYEYSLTNCDTLPKVRNTEGDYYQDNRLTLKISRGNTSIFNRTFAKEDFDSFVPANMLEKSILVGCAFNPLNTNDASALHFFITVGNPDETADEDFTMDVRITTTGSISIDKATNIDTESLNPDMNINPSTEGGV